MGNPSDDLDRFLKADGIRTLSGTSIPIAWEPLTAEDIVDFSSMNLDILDEYALGDLLEKAEDLLEQLNLSKPWNEDYRQHNLWETRASETVGFITRIREQLRKMDEEQKGGKNDG